MSVKENKELVGRLAELLNMDPGQVWEIHDPGYVEHYGDRVVPLAQVKEMVAGLGGAFSNPRFIMEDVIGEGDRIAYRATWTFEHTGEFMGNPPTGRTVKVTYPAMMRIANGKIAEWWGAGGEFMQQLADQTRP